MNVLELVRMRMAVLSPGTETQLRLAQEQVKLHQVDVHAKEIMRFERDQNERVSELVDI